MVLFFPDHLALIMVWFFYSERGLSLVLFGLTQEEFLNRLMIYGSAGVVDSVCRLNGWEQCSIPVHALEVKKMVLYPTGKKILL